MLISQSIDEARSFFYPTYGYENTDILAVETVGKTLPDPEYYIKRNDCNYYILELVISGKGYLYNDGKYYTLVKDNAYLLRPHSDHTYFADKNEPFVKIWINFFCSSPEPFLRTIRNDRTVFYNVGCKNKFYELYNLMLPRVTDFSFKANTYDEIYLDVVNIIFDILISLTKDNSVAEPQSVEKTLKSILDTGTFQKIDIAEIAKSLFVSPQVLSYKFKKAYGITPYRYYLDLKIETAKNMLLLSKLGIEEISEKLCFPNPFYFSNIFKQKTGVRPKMFRTRNLP